MYPFCYEQNNTGCGCIRISSSIQSFFYDSSKSKLKIYNENDNKNNTTLDGQISKKKISNKNKDKTSGSQCVVVIL